MNNMNSKSKFSYIYPVPPFLCLMLLKKSNHDDIPIYKELIKEKVINEVQNDVQSFSDIHSSFKTMLDFESWRGFRFGLFYHPSHKFNFESHFFCDKPKGFKNFSLNAYTSIHGTYIK